MFGPVRCGRAVSAYADPVSGRRGVKAWLISLAAVGLVIGVIAAFGGWAPTTAQAARAQRPGVAMQIPGWIITVHSAEIVNYSGPDDEYPEEESEVVVHLDLTSTDDESASSLPGGVVQILLPDGTALENGLAQQTEPWSGNWDPGVAFPSQLDSEIVGLTLDDAAPTHVIVLVHDLVPSRGFLRAPGQMDIGPARWRIELDTPDRRRPVVE